MVRTPDWMTTRWQPSSIGWSRTPHESRWMNGMRNNHALVRSGPELTIRPLLTTEAIEIRDIVCRGECRHESADECAERTHLVFPYRGVYVRHVGRNDAVAEANQVVFFNA